jgi:hypothetical protein
MFLVEVIDEQRGERERFKASLTQEAKLVGSMVQAWE